MENLRNCMKNFKEILQKNFKYFMENFRKFYGFFLEILMEIQKEFCETL